MKKLVSLMVIGAVALGSMLLSGCVEKMVVQKDESGNVIYNADGSPVTTTVYVGVITGKEYSKEAIDSGVKIVEGVYLVGKEIVVANSDLIPVNAMTKLKELDDIANRVDEARAIIQDAQSGK